MVLLNPFIGEILVYSTLLSTPWRLEIRARTLENDFKDLEPQSLRSNTGVVFRIRRFPRLPRLLDFKDRENFYSNDPSCFLFSLWKIVQRRRRKKVRGIEVKWEKRWISQPDQK